MAFGSRIRNRRNRWKARRELTDEINEYLTVNPDASKEDVEKHVRESLIDNYGENASPWLKLLLELLLEVLENFFFN